MTLSREEDFFTPKLPLLGVRGVMKFTKSCLLTLQMLHTKFGKDWPCSSCEKMLTDDAQRTTTDANQ